jgi:hypothetical protein
MMAEAHGTHTANTDKHREDRSRSSLSKASSANPSGAGDDTETYKLVKNRRNKKLIL